MQNMKCQYIQGFYLTITCYSLLKLITEQCYEAKVNDVELCQPKYQVTDDMIHNFWKQNETGCPTVLGDLLGPESFPSVDRCQGCNQYDNASFKGSLKSPFLLLRTSLSDVAF